MTIAVLGHGNVGAPLADHLQRAGHQVVIAARDASAESVRELLQRNPALQVAAIRDAIASAEVVLLAVPFGVVESVIPPLADVLAGKVLVDCTNPVGPGLTHGLTRERSGSAVVQSLAPQARVVKAFTIYGYENLEDHDFGPGAPKPAMFYCGDDAAAKETVGGLIADLGWEPLDCGALSQALHLEHMTLLWIAMVRVGKRSPHLVWAALSK